MNPAFLLLLSITEFSLMLGLVSPPVPAQRFQGFRDTGFHMSFGIGAFPFGFFTTVFNANDPFHRPGEHRTYRHGSLKPAGMEPLHTLYILVAN